VKHHHHIQKTILIEVKLIRHLPAEGIAQHAPFGQRDGQVRRTPAVVQKRADRFLVRHRIAGGRRIRRGLHPGKRQAVGRSRRRTGARGGRGRHIAGQRDHSQQHHQPANYRQWPRHWTKRVAHRVSLSHYTDQPCVTLVLRTLELLSRTPSDDTLSMWDIDKILTKSGVPSGRNSWFLHALRAQERHLNFSNGRGTRPNSQRPLFTGMQSPHPQDFSCLSACYLRTWFALH
jgi:hypothetical protein